MTSNYLLDEKINSAGLIKKFFRRGTVLHRKDML